MYIENSNKDIFIFGFNNFWKHNFQKMTYFAEKKLRYEGGSSNVYVVFMGV